ncbi:hypothetical protein J6A34_00735 [bacterium]|nr:hypothetical protein [bacterium]
MDKFVVKNIIIFSLMLGLILGLLAPIPYVGTFILFVALLLSAPIIMLYLIMDNRLELTTTKDSIITGAIVGFVVNISFSIAYASVMAILAKFINYSSNFILTTMIVNSPIWLLGVFIIFIGVLCATTNSFSGFVTYYIINFIRDMYEKQLPKNKEDDDFTLQK